VKHESPKSKPEIEAEIALKRNWLRAASMVAGSHHSSPAETKVAGNEAAKLKEELSQLERDLETAKAA